MEVGMIYFFLKKFGFLQKPSVRYFHQKMYPALFIFKKT